MPFDEWLFTVVNVHPFNSFVRIHCSFRFRAFSLRVMCFVCWQTSCDGLVRVGFHVCCLSSCYVSERVWFRVCWQTSCDALERDVFRVRCASSCYALDRDALRACSLTSCHVRSRLALCGAMVYHARVRGRVRNKHVQSALRHRPGLWAGPPIESPQIRPSMPPLTDEHPQCG